MTQSNPRTNNNGLLLDTNTIKIKDRLEIVIKFDALDWNRN